MADRGRGRAVAVLWSGALLRLARWRRRRQDRVRALWDGMCARLARAGLPRAPHEGPLAYAARAAQRWPEFAAAFGVIGESYAVLRYGPVRPRIDTIRRGRAPALARLETRDRRSCPHPRPLRSAPMPA